MKKFTYFSLRLKIAIFILIGTILFSVLILFLTYQYVNRTLTKSLIEQGRVVAANIAELAAEKLIEDDMVGLRAIIEKNKYYSNIEYILIEVGHSNTEFGEDTFYRVKPINVFSQSLQVYDIKQAIKEGLLGFVRVGMQKSFVSVQVRDTITYLGIIFLIGIFLAIILTIFIITLQFSKPITHLTEMAYKISMGDFNKPVRVQVKNEIGVLAEAIERMRESLKSSIDRLKNR